MANVDPEDALELATGEDHQPVPALGSHGPNPTLGECVGSGPCDRRTDRVDPLASEDLIEDDDGKVVFARSRDQGVPYHVTSSCELRTQAPPTLRAMEVSRESARRWGRFCPFERGQLQLLAHLSAKGRRQPDGAENSIAAVDASEQEVMAGASDRFAAWARLDECSREKLEKDHPRPAHLLPTLGSLQAEAQDAAA
jgi:hypothetical protein